MITKTEYSILKQLQQFEFLSEDELSDFNVKGFAIKLLQRGYITLERRFNDGYKEIAFYTLTPEGFEAIEDYEKETNWFTPRFFVQSIVVPVIVGGLSAALATWIINLIV